MKNRLNIEYDLNNLENILKKKVFPKESGFLEFINSSEKSIFKKPKKENIFELKKKLERIESYFEVRFNDCLIYKELIDSFENLKSSNLIFNNSTLEEGTEKKILKLLDSSFTIRVSGKMNKTLFFVLKNQYKKFKNKNLILYSLEYNSIRTLFFGINLSILNLSYLRINKKELRKVLRSLHAIKSLRSLYYDNRKAYGLVHQLNKEVKKHSVDMTIEPKDSKGLFFNLPPPWISKITIRSSYEKKDFQLLLTKFYNGGVLSEFDSFNENIFGFLTNKSDSDWFKYVLSLKNKKS